MKQLQLYMFDYQSYGQYYLVMSHSPEEALQHLIARLKKDRETDKYDTGYYKLWKSATIDKLPKGYSLKVFGVNEVVIGEYS